MEILNWMVMPNKRLTRKMFFWIAWGLYFTSSVLLAVSFAKWSEDSFNGLMVFAFYQFFLILWTWRKLDAEFGSYFIATPFLVAIILIPFFEPLLAWVSIILLLAFVAFGSLSKDGPSKSSQNADGETTSGQGGQDG